MYKKKRIQYCLVQGGPVTVRCYGTLPAGVQQMRGWPTVRTSVNTFEINTLYTEELNVIGLVATDILQTDSIALNVTVYNHKPHVLTVR